MEPAAQPRAAVSGDEEGLSPGVPSTSAQLTRLEVSYPLRFKAFVASVVVVAQLWVFNLFLVEDPDSGGGVVELEDCDYDGALLRRHVMVLSAFFACFAAVRALVFVPSLATRVVEARLGLLGPCWDGAATAVLHAPLYIFTIGSWVLWILTLARCYFVAELSLYFNHASYGCLVSLWCLCLARWHGILLSRASRVASRRAPPNTIHTLPTISYDPALFGDEDGKHYPGECPICLLDWEDEDSIKLTGCGHAFHEECLGLWLDKERTCAICRQDISTALKLFRPVPVPATGGGGDAAERQPQTPGESPIDRQTSDSWKVDSQTWTSSGSVSPRRDNTPRREARHRQLLEAAANSEQMRSLSRSVASSSGSGSTSRSSSWFNSQRRQQGSPDQSEGLPEAQHNRTSQTSASSGGNRSRPAGGFFLGGSIPLTMELVSLALGSHSMTAAHSRESPRQAGRRISGSSSLAAHSRELRSQATAPAGRLSARSESTTGSHSCGSAEPHAHGAAAATSMSPRIPEGGPSAAESGLHLLPTFTV